MKSILAVITQVYLPGYHPEHPIELPPEGGEQPPEPGGPSDAHPAHPIYYPDAHPDHTLPGDLPHPAHPIVLPPADGGPPPEIPTVPGYDQKVGWTEDTGWVVVYVPTGEHVTPS